MFRAGSQSGEAAIYASSGGATVSQALAIKIGAPRPRSESSLSASPTSVPVTGGMSQLMAIVFDASGNPLAGVPVTFVATAGTLRPFTVVTGANGDARTTMRTDRETTVTATAGGQVADVTIRATPGPSGSSRCPPPTRSSARRRRSRYGASVSSGGSPIQVVVAFGDGDSTRISAPCPRRRRSRTSTAGPARSRRRSRPTDTAGFQTQVSTIVNVTAAPPLAVTISRQPDTGRRVRRSRSPLTVTVSGGATLPAIKRYEWDFGDGSGGGDHDRQPDEPRFLSVGVKVIRVTVVRGGWLDGRGSMEVTVSSTATTPLSVSITTGTSTPTVGVPVAFTASVSGTSGGIARYEWDFGDGTSVQVTTGNQTSHNFTTAGTRTIRVTVVGLNGSTGVGQTEVVVRAAD